jgi:predicted negative regulator of RcsB-dependent stress response
LTDQGKSDEALKTLSESMPPAFAGPYHEVRGDAYLAKKDVSGARTEYTAALAAGGADGAGGVNTSLLELKIQDLGAPAPPAKPNAVDATNKAKP